MANETGHKAEEVLKALEMWHVPVSPFDIAKEEGIELAGSSDYGRGFDARIEYLEPVKTFAIYFQEVGPGYPPGRVRFSIAHELGHFYLHQDYLLSGQAHDSVPNFRSTDLMETEADTFAAELLMPKELFRTEVKKYRQSVCTLKDLCHLASNVFQTSITSTVRRYCDLDIEAAAMIISEDKRVKWAVHSEDMRRLRMGYIQFGDAVSPESKTAELWRRLGEKSDADPIEGSVEPTVWYDRPSYRKRLWEEAMPLGYTGLVLTYITLEP